MLYFILSLYLEILQLQRTGDLFIIPRPYAEEGF